MFFMERKILMSKTIDESFQSIFSYIERCNLIRPHSALGGMPPIEYSSYL